MSIRWAGVLALTLVVAGGAAGAGAATGREVFYLSVRTHTCLVASIHAGSAGHKKVTIVPCADPAHDMEVYGIGHGGWGHVKPPSDAVAILRSVCLSLYQRVTGHQLRVYGWYGFYPDPGAETARYGDKMICSLRTYPVIRPLGAGWHVH